MAGKSFRDLLSTCRKHKYFEFSLSESSIALLKCSNHYGLLRDKVIKEWKYQSNSKVNDLMIEPRKTDNLLTFNYFNSEEFVKNFEVFKQRNVLPFSISEILTAPPNQQPNEESLQVNVDLKTVLRTSYFVKQSMSKETLFQIQRQRKIKWMKYSVNPQKYFISDQRTEDFQGVSINYLSINSIWKSGEQLELEKIKLFPLKSFLDSNKIDSFTFSRKKEIPWVIQSVTCLETATLNIILDAIELSADGTFKFHRRLAPYQISIVKMGCNKELLDLARYIEMLIENADKSINILNSSSIEILDEKSLLTNFVEIDKSIGIPYSLVVDDNTLKTGLLELRNRDTTLSETIHISDIPSYIVKIFNSF